MSGKHFCFTSPDDPEPLECEQCAVFAERADYWRDAAEKRDAWLDAEMDRRRAAEAEVERLRAALHKIAYLQHDIGRPPLISEAEAMRIAARDALYDSRIADAARGKS